MTISPRGEHRPVELRRRWSLRSACQDNQITQFWLLPASYSFSWLSSSVPEVSWCLQRSWSIASCSWSRNLSILPLFRSALENLWWVRQATSGIPCSFHPDRWGCRPFQPAEYWQSWAQLPKSHLNLLISQCLPCVFQDAVDSTCLLSHENVHYDGTQPKPMQIASLALSSCW